MRAPSSSPTCRPSTRTCPPSPALPCTLSRPATSVVPASSVMRPPTGPSASVWLPAARSSVSPADKRIWPALLPVPPPASPPVPPPASISPCWLTSAACRWMRPSRARNSPVLTALPAGRFTRTAMCGELLSTNSMLRPAASTVCPPGVSMRPWLNTPPGPPSSRTWPPVLLRNSPRLRTSASIRPWSAGVADGANRFSRLACQSALLMRKVEATRLAVSTRALAPNSTPFGFSNQTPPLLLIRPRISDVWPPTTRLSTWLAALGCSNRTA